MLNINYFLNFVYIKYRDEPISCILSRRKTSITIDLQIRIYSALRASYIRIYESIEFRPFSLTDLQSHHDIQNYVCLWTRNLDVPVSNSDSKRGSIQSPERMKFLSRTKYLFQPGSAACWKCLISLHVYIEQSLSWNALFISCRVCPKLFISKYSNLPHPWGLNGGPLIFPIPSLTYYTIRNQVTGCIRFVPGRVTRRYPF